MQALVLSGNYDSHAWLHIYPIKVSSWLPVSNGSSSNGLNSDIRHCLFLSLTVSFFSKQLLPMYTFSAACNGIFYLQMSMCFHYAHVGDIYAEIAWVIWSVEQSVHSFDFLKNVFPLQVFSWKTFIHAEECSVHAEEWESLNVVCK